MNKKGFTLVELLGVIVLLGILGVVIMPQIGDSIANSKQKSYQAQEQNIKKGTTDFLIENPELLEKDGTYTIKLKTLKQGGYLPINIKNPKTRKNFSDESKITITKTNDNYEITLNLIDLKDVSETLTENSPVIVLNGNYIEYVEVNSVYNELGAIAKSSNGDIIDDISIQIKLNDEPVTTIDTSRLNTYSVIYSATDSGDNEASATRTVIVRDTTPPAIKLPTNNTVQLVQFSSFNPRIGVVVSDNFDNNISYTVNSTVIDKVGNYVVTYTAVDSSGNKASERRIINVTDDNYKTLEYVKADGHQYIELDYKAKTNTKIELDIELIENELTNIYNDFTEQKGTNIIGTSNSSDDYTFSCNFGRVNSQNNQIFYWVDERYKSGMGGIAYSRDYDQVTDRSLMTMQSGRSTFQDSTLTIAQKTTDNVDNMVLIGSFYTSRNAITPLEVYDAKIYGLKIYEGNTLIMDLTPAYNSKTEMIGLYDKINNKFYKSNGDKDFLYE